MGMSKEEFRNRVIQDQLQRKVLRDNEFIAYTRKRHGAKKPLSYLPFYK